jgi:hypothetical protein
MSGNTLSELRSASGPPDAGRLRLRWTTACVVLRIGIGAVGEAHADPSIALPSGLPVQVHPTFSEPGLPAFSFPVSGSSSVGGSSSSVDDSGGSGSGASSSGSVGTGGSADAYNTMMAQDWGSQAADAASAMGVSATALAATCAMESNCQNVGAASGSSAAGAFQMINSTYTADISGAIAYDPGIAGSIVSGLGGQMDPATEAYAASYELRSDALMLQNGTDISNPTVPGRSGSVSVWGWRGTRGRDRRRLREYRPTHWAERGLTCCKWAFDIKHGWPMAGHGHCETWLRNRKPKRVGSVTWRAS